VNDYHGRCPAVQTSKTEGDMGSTIGWIDKTIVTIASRLFVACPSVTESFDVVIDWTLLGIDVRGSGRLVSCHLNQSIKKWATNPDTLAKYLCFHFFGLSPCIKPSVITFRARVNIPSTNVLQCLFQIMRFALASVQCNIYTLYATKYLVPSLEAGSSLVQALWPAGPWPFECAHIVNYSRPRSQHSTAEVRCGES